MSRYNNASTLYELIAKKRRGELKANVTLQR